MIKRCTFIAGLICFLSQAKVADAQFRINADSVAAAVPLKSTVVKEHKLIAFIPPVAMIGYGALSFRVAAIRRLDYNIKADRMEDMPTFHTSVDNFMQYTPSVAAFAFSAMNVKGKHNFGDRTGIFLLTEGLMSGSIYFFKKSGGRLRPNEANYLSFPSGHTANAFAAAEFLNEEYGDQSKWYGIAGYSIATATGICRVYNNAHWFSDVIAGAGFGILSAKAAGVVYPFLKRNLFQGGNSKTILVPQYGQGYVGAAFVCQL